MVPAMITPAIPPTPREALEALDVVIKYPCADNSKQLATVRAALECAAAESEAWEKLRAIVLGNHPINAISCQVGLNPDHNEDWNVVFSRSPEYFVGPTRLEALQAAAAFCEKEMATK